jgi:hypothetical protein
MAKNLRWKLLTILGVVALAVFAFYPPDQKIPPIRTRCSAAR